MFVGYEFGFLFCCVVLSVISSFASILPRKRSSLCSCYWKITKATNVKPFASHSSLSAKIFVCFYIYKSATSTIQSAIRIPLMQPEYTHFIVGYTEEINSFWYLQ